MLISRSVEGMRGLRWFSWAYTAAALEVLLVYLQPSHPALATLFGGRMLLVLAAVLLTEGIAQFTGPGATILAWGKGLLIAFALLEIGLLLSNREMAAVAFLLAFSFQLLTGIFFLLSHNVPGECASSRSIAVLLGAIIALCIAAIVGPVPQDLFMIAYLVLSAGLAFGFIWMTMVRLRTQLDLQARTDELTSLLNRRGLETEAQRELTASQRSQTPLAVVVLDLDHFKELNDQFGHAAGDTALTAAARMLAQCLRSSDLLGRLGGEEFVAILPARDAERASLVAERLRSRLEALCVDYEGQALRVTASFGVTMATAADSWPSLLKRADSALYEAKRTGRNRICSSASPAAAAGTQPGVASASAASH